MNRRKFSLWKREKLCKKEKCYPYFQLTMDCREILWNEVNKYVCCLHIGLRIFCWKFSQFISPASLPWDFSFSPFFSGLFKYFFSSSFSHFNISIALYCENFSPLFLEKIYSTEITTTAVAANSSIDNKKETLEKFLFYFSSYFWFFIP